MNPHDATFETEFFEHSRCRPFQGGASDDGGYGDYLFSALFDDLTDTGNFKDGFTETNGFDGAITIASASSRDAITDGPGRASSMP